MKGAGHETTLGNHEVKQDTHTPGSKVLCSVRTSCVLPINLGGQAGTFNYHHNSTYVIIIGSAERASSYFRYHDRMLELSDRLVECRYSK